jgi:hypothetical protein
MAEDCPVAYRQNGRHPCRVSGRDAVPDGEDAPIQRMQPSTRDTVRESAAPDAERGQLAAGDDAVLARRERRNRRVDGSTVT